MIDDDLVFKALADPTRRFLLDQLFSRDGRTLTELESTLEMTRFGVMKHLRVLEEAGLVVARKQGREKLHFLNPVPIREAHDRWIDKYTERHVEALLDLKHILEGQPMAVTTETKTIRVYEVYIKATPDAIWEAIVKPEWTQRYGYGGITTLDPRVGGAYAVKATEELMGYGMPEDLLVGEVLEIDPPRRLVQTWHPIWSPQIGAEPFTTLTYELKPAPNGVTKLTLTHDVTGAPLTDEQISGTIEGAGGGWAYVLSDLKSLLETGRALGSPEA